MKLAEKFSLLALQNNNTIINNKPNSITIENDIDDIIIKNSITKFNSIISNIEKLLLKTKVGAIHIILDHKFDLFGLKEEDNPNKLYSASYVLNLLSNEDFGIIRTEDYYDSKKYFILWNNSLPYSNITLSMNINANI